jgi:hypothetical protein
MFTKTSDLFQYIGLSLFGPAVMVALIYFIGVIPSLIIGVVMLFGQSALSFVRTTALQRELAILRQELDGVDRKIIDKA